MELYATRPMPEHFGQQVQTPQGWKFRHCATFFSGDMCPDCCRSGFLAAQASMEAPLLDAGPSDEELAYAEEEAREEAILDAAIVVNRELLNRTREELDAAQDLQFQNPSNELLTEETQLGVVLDPVDAEMQRLADIPHDDTQTTAPVQGGKPGRKPKQTPTP